MNSRIFKSFLVKNWITKIWIKHIEYFIMESLLILEGFQETSIQVRFFKHEIFLVCNIGNSFFSSINYILYVLYYIKCQSYIVSVSLSYVCWQKNLFSPFFWHLKWLRLYELCSFDPMVLCRSFKLGWGKAAGSCFNVCMTHSLNTIFYKKINVVRAQ